MKGLMKNKDKYSNELLTTFLNDTDIFKKEDLIEVRNVLANKYASDINLFQLISLTPERRNKLGSTSQIENVVKRFNDRSEAEADPNDEEGLVSDDSNSIKLLDSILNFEEEFLNDNVIFHVANFISIVLRKDLESFEKNETHFILNPIKKLCDLILPKLKLQTKGHIDLLLKISDTVEEGFIENNFADSKSYFGLIELIRNLEYPEIHAKAKADLDDLIADFLNRSSYSTFQTVVESERVFIEYVQEEKFKDVLYKRTCSDSGLVKNLWQIFSDEERQNILSHWIPNQPNQTSDNLLKVLESVNYNVPEKEIFAQQIIAKMVALQHGAKDDQVKYAQVLIKLDLGNDFNTESLVKHITALVKNGDSNINGTGVVLLEELKTKLIGNSITRAIAKEALFNLFPNLNGFHVAIEQILQRKFFLTVEDYNLIYSTHKNPLINFIIQNARPFFLELFVAKLSADNINDFYSGILVNMTPKINQNPSLISGYQKIINIFIRHVNKESHNKYHKELVNVFGAVLSRMTNQNDIYFAIELFSVIKKTDKIIDEAMLNLFRSKLIESTLNSEIVANTLKEIK